MGKYRKGILGYFRGKVGAVVGAIWNGIQYMRSLPDVGADNPTQAQLNVRARMALISAFLKRLKNAITGTSSLNYTIDYTKVVLRLLILARMMCRYGFTLCVLIGVLSIILKVESIN
jgi:hypothetical protein